MRERRESAKQKMYNLNIFYENLIKNDGFYDKIESERRLFQCEFLFLFNLNIYKRNIFQM